MVVLSDDQNALRYGDSTQLVFSGIGNVHAVKDAFEEMRDSLDPVKTESKMDRWRDDSSKMVAKRVVSFECVVSCRPPLAALDWLSIER